MLPMNGVVVPAKRPARRRRYADSLKRRVARVVGKISPRFSGRVWPVVLFVIYTAIAIGIGIFIFRSFDIGKETTTTKVTEPNGDVTTTVADKQSIPIILIFTTLAAGGLTCPHERYHTLC